MTRWAEVASVARITAAEVSKFVLDYISSRFVTPLEILSDRGLGFRADLLDALLESLSIKHVHSTSYYPQCNGLVEKINGVLCKIITKHVRDRPQDWDKHLTAALWAYRMFFKVSTQFTPYHLVYGQVTLLPIEVELGSLRVLVRETTSSKEKLEQRIIDLQRLELDRKATIDYYITQVNKKREQFNNKVKEKKLEEGMLVMRYDSRLNLSHNKKFLQRWEGPYFIFKKFKNGSYRLQDLSGKIVSHMPVNDLSWAEENVDPALFSRELVERAVTALDSEVVGTCPRQLLAKAHEATSAIGAATAIIAILEKETGVLHVANLGDCGLRVVRGGKIVFATLTQQHYFDCPYQLSSEPGAQTSRDAMVYKVELLPGDIVVMGSDGLFDNVFDKDIESTVNCFEGSDDDRPQRIASALASLASKHSKDKKYESPYSQEAILQASTNLLKLS
ncbi:hypothetical protein L7F22_037099 [Adiantum nelumboides]|nr:hypothetical protein [Adiantum nelumboides]